MFIDRAVFLVESGHGGNGAVSFRREKYVPRGGPDGGRGGKGGSVILRATARKNTLYDLTFQPKYQAEPGEAGGGSNKAGAEGKDCILEVPVGTQVFDEEEHRFLADLVMDGQEVVIARGGRGGRGNATYRTPTNRAPRVAEQGEREEARRIRLELKMIADVGIVGLPNAGKSTFLASVTRAKPLVADYPFSTLQPNLGVVDRRGQRLILVDIPGIIEGASQGTGLGLEFLRHIERTRFLVFLVDVSIHAQIPPLEAFRILREECERYSATLPHKPYAVIATKGDLEPDEEGLAALEHSFSEQAVSVFTISAPIGRGLETVLDFLVRSVQDLPADETTADLPGEPLPAYSRVSEKEYRFQSPFLERILRETGTLDEEGLTRLNQTLKESGFFHYLKPLREYSIVNIGQVRLIWDGRTLSLEPHTH